MSILDVTETPFKDDSIEEYEYFEYLPIVGAVNSLNREGGVITITIETQDVFMHPSESYLLIEGELTKNDGTPYADGDNVTLTNNGLMYLFNFIRYNLSEKEIEIINHPGWATTIIGLLKYDNNFSESRGLNQLWYKDTGPLPNDNKGFEVRQSLITRKPHNKGKFGFSVPLKHIFGFCEDYDKVLYGMKQTLTLARAGDNDAIFRDGAADPGKVTLTKIAWFMPHVLPTDRFKMELYKQIQDKKSFPVNFRMIQCEASEPLQETKSFTWRLAVKTSPEFPRYIIIGFKHKKQNQQEQNPAVFNHTQVTNIHVTLNSYKYPRADYLLSFTDQQFSRAYTDAAKFRSKFFHMDDLVSNPNFTPLEYKDLYPLFVFDVGKQSERLKYAVSNIHVKANFRSNVTAVTHAYAVVISDRLINLQSDGNRMNVVY